MSGAEQFQLDVDVDSLRAAQYGLQRLAEHLATVATTTTRIPADIGDGWTGPAATVMKAELVGLGAQSTRFGPMFDDAAMALRAFADAAGTFQTETVPRYTRAWDRAESEARSANDKADRALDEQVREANSLPDHGAGSQARAEARNINGVARGQVASGQRAAMAALTSQFADLKAELAQVARATGAAMADLTVVAVPDSVARDFLGHHGSGLSLGWCNVDGSTFPPDLGSDGALPGMTLVKDMHDMADGEQAAREFNQTFATGPQSRAELDTFLTTLNGDSEAFRQAFLAGMDPAILPFMQTAARTGVDAQTGMKYGEVITALSQIMAKASNDKTQGNYPVPSSFFDDLRSQYKNTIPPEQGYLLLAEIVQAGQGGHDTWDPALLTGITKDTIGFERELHKTNPTFFWGDVFRNNNGVLPTRAGRDLTGAVPGRVDAVAMLLDSVGHNADASQDVLRGPDGNADLGLLHYLYDGRRGVGGDAFVCGQVFGNVLEQAATHHRGSGGPGSRDYVSAQIASDLVNYAGEKPDDRILPGMEQNIVDILTVHMDAVNHFTESALISDRAVGIGAAGDPLPWNHDTHANFNSGRLDSLMTTAFRSDYQSAQVDGTAHASMNTHPLLSQFTLAQQATWQQDITYAAGHLADYPGQLEELARKHGASSNATITAYGRAIHAEGGREDAAQASAREAVDFVLGLGLDKIAEKVPGGPGLGVPKLIAGNSLDALKSSAIDMVLPEGDAADRMAGIGAALSDNNVKTGALAYLKWLDQPGQGPSGAASYDSWARVYPDNQRFLKYGADGHWHIKDPGQIYLDKGTPGGQETWEDFVKYCNDAGVPWLMHQDLYENFTDGTRDTR